MLSLCSSFGRGNPHVPYKNHKLTQVMCDPQFNRRNRRNFTWSFKLRSLLTSIIVNDWWSSHHWLILIISDHWLMTQRSIMSFFPVLFSVTNNICLSHVAWPDPASATSRPDRNCQVRCLGRNVQDADVCELFTGQLQLRGMFRKRAELEALDVWISRDNIRSDGYHMEIV